MGLVVSRNVGETFWVGDDWFKVDTIGKSSFTVVDRKGSHWDIHQDSTVEIIPGVKIEEGFRRSISRVRVIVNAPKEMTIARGELRESAVIVTSDQTEAALLAPVPYEHLASGLDICRTEGKVAFGSRAFEVFRDLERLTQGGSPPVLIYASSDDAKFPTRATWLGVFAGAVETNNGRHPDGMTFRPPTTVQYTGDNLGHWAVFWEVSALRQVGYKEGVSIGNLHGYRSKKQYMKNYRPEGPMIIENPFL